MRRPLLLAIAATSLLALATPARAQDRFDVTTTLFQEQRRGNLGGLRVVHQQADLGVDLGDNASLGVGYSADVVSGATAAVYQCDAVSTATEFDDVRHEGRVNLGLKGRRSSLTLVGGAGVERDYASLSAGAAGSISLPGKNTTIALSYTHSFDEVCDRDNAQFEVLERRPLTGIDECRKERGIFGVDTPGMTVWQDLSIDTVQATLTQNLTPTANLQVSSFGQILSGFQENPYRRVRVGNNEPQESVPEVRARLAVMARANRFLPPVRGAVHAMLRGYSDTWGVNSATAELGYSQYLGSALLLKARARVYQQTAASFFKDAFFYQTESTAGAFFTGDRELARVRNILFGGRLTYLNKATEEGGKPILGVFDRLQLNIKSDVILLSHLPSDDIDANFCAIDGDFSGVDGQFISSGLAFVVQFGLLLGF